VTGVAALSHVCRRRLTLRLSWQHRPVLLKNEVKNQDAFIYFFMLRSRTSEVSLSAFLYAVKQRNALYGAW
jgi:hypothetical protein